MFRAALRTRLTAVPRAPLASRITMPHAAAQVRFLATPVEPPTDVSNEPLSGEGVEDLLGPRYAEEESTAIIKRYRGKGFPMIPVSRLVQCRDCAGISS